MKNAKTFILLVFLVTTLGYGFKKYGHFLMKFTEGPMAIMTEPSQALNVIEASGLDKSLQEDLFRITKIFASQFPDEKTFSLSQRIREHEMVNQRMLEVNFPKVLSADARCGFVFIDEEKELFDVINQAGGYKIVCAR